MLICCRKINRNLVASKRLMIFYLSIHEQESSVSDAYESSSSLVRFSPLIFPHSLIHKCLPSKNRVQTSDKVGHKSLRWNKIVLVFKVLQDSNSFLYTWHLDQPLIL